MPSIVSNPLSDPEKMPGAFVTAWMERDAHQLASRFTKDADFVNVVGLWWHDRKAICKAHDYGLRVIFPDSQLSVRQVRSRYIGTDAAIIQARFRLRGQTARTDQENPGIRFTIFTFVMQRFDQGWLCVTAHNTDQQAGKETNVVDQDGNLEPVDYRRQDD